MIFSRISDHRAPHLLRRLAYARLAVSAKPASRQGHSLQAAFAPLGYSAIVYSFWKAGTAFATKLYLGSRQVPHHA